MVSRVTLGDIEIDVVLKDIKNINLSVHPPMGRVRISAPSSMNRDAIHVFAISRLNWIKKQQRAVREQDREERREYVDRESHNVWGKAYLLKISEVDQPPSVELDHMHMLLRLKTGTDVLKREAIVEGWYRGLSKSAIPPLLARWEPRMGVKAKRFYVQRMKTIWGSCNRKARTIRINTELAKKPHEYLEYIVVHELAHLLEPTHNARFVAIMDRFMPQWKLHRAALNNLPSGNIRGVTDVA